MASRTSQVAAAFLLFWCLLGCLGVGQDPDVYYAYNADTSHSSAHFGVVGKAKVVQFDADNVKTEDAVREKRMAQDESTKEKQPLVPSSEKEMNQSKKFKGLLLKKEEPAKPSGAVEGKKPASPGFNNTPPPPLPQTTSEPPQSQPSPPPPPPPSPTAGNGSNEKETVMPPTVPDNPTANISGDATNTSTVAVTTTTTQPSPVVTVESESPTTSYYDIPDPRPGQNITMDNQNYTTKEDSHKYYNSTFISNPSQGQQLWVDMSTNANASVHEMLSKSHRRAATVQLTFPFPFYGHEVRNVTIATGGFLYTGTYVHSWLAATQYIAPLMANFDTSKSNDSQVQYADNGTAFTVEWDNVVLQDNTSAGLFTFQVTLHKSGDIVFVYRSVPVMVTDIMDVLHPVKVGLSDAYIIDRTIFFVRRKTIYEYHRVDLRNERISDWTAIYFKALPTCMTLKDCESCVSENIGFNCQWCADVQRCSDGMDRNRQDWLVRSCDKASFTTADQCRSGRSSQPSVNPERHGDFTTDSSTMGGIKAASDAIIDNQGWSIRPTNNKTAAQNVVPTSPYHFISSEPPLEPSPEPYVTVVAQSVNALCTSDSLCNEEDDHDSVSVGVAGAIGILFVVTMILGLLGWVFYAYRYPHTPSGQFLIKYRPSQWSWRRGEARYTAASIHM